MVRISTSRSEFPSRGGLWLPADRGIEDRPSHAPVPPIVRDARDGGVTVKVSWRLDTPTIRSDAEMLRRLSNMPPKGVAPRTRANGIIATACVGGRAAKLPSVILNAALMLIGYTAEGDRIRFSWFEHARV
jgi:hypothetical protein